MAQPSELHPYRVRSGQDTLSHDYDARKEFSLYVSLRRKHPQRNDPALRRFGYYVNIDLEGGGSSLGLSLFFLTAASTFDCFRDIVVVDEESLEAENVEVYHTRDEFRRHAIREMRSWPNGDSWIAQVIDAQGNFIE